MCISTPPPRIFVYCDSTERLARLGYQSRPLFAGSFQGAFMSDFNVVGFIGLGTMGLPMATNLLNAGLKVHGFDVDPGAQDKLSERGGISGFASAAEAC